MTVTDQSRAVARGRIRVRPRAAPDRSLPAVSVVVPCFNYGRYLPEAVGSVLSQTGVRVQVIVVDDASSDDSRAVAAALAAGDDRVTLLEHEVNRGPVQTFNDGLRLVTGEFVVRLDADDLLTPGALARATTLARIFPSVGLVYGHPVHFAGGHPARPARQRARSWTVWDGRGWLADRCADGLNVITSPEVLMRRSVVDRVGGQMPLAHTHDMEMWLRLAAFSDVAHLNGCDQAWHRDHPASLSARCVDMMTDLRERRAAFETLFAGVAGTLPQAATLRHQSRVALAVDAVTKASHILDRGRGAPELVDLLEQFALDTWPGVTGHPAWRALRRRRVRTRPLSPRHPRAFLPAAAQRVHGELTYRRWARTGVYREGS